MRKLLLGTTAAVGVALIGATTASAQTAPTVRIGGYFDFSLGYVNDNADRNLPPAGAATVGAGISRWDFRADTEIHVLVEGKAANGLTYGARIEFEMDAVGVGAAGTTFNTDEMWMFVSSPTLGTLRFGDTDSAAGVMQVRPPRYVGFNGLRINWVRQGGTRYMFGSLNDGADNTKVVYLSPQFAGFDFGLSFALNGGEGEREVRGVGVSPTSTAVSLAGLQRGRIDRENEFTGAIRYRGTFGAVGVAAGFGFTTATAPSNRVATVAPNIGLEEQLAARTQNPTAYSIGLSVSFSGLTLGGEYTWGRYAGSSPGLIGAEQGRGDSRHWLLGASYAIPSAGLTITGNFGRGTQDTSTGAIGDLTSRLFGIGVTYALAPGWSLYAYYENIRDNNYRTAIGGLAAGQRRSTDGLVIGTSLTF